MPELVPGIHVLALAVRTWMAGTSPAMTECVVRAVSTSPLLLRLPLLGRPTGVAPGGVAAGDVGDGLEAHVLRGLGGERRAQAAGAMKDELLVLLEHRLRIRALRIDPEFEHAARAGERAGDAAVSLD